MKGKLHYADTGWVVDYPQTFNNGRLLLHPDFTEMMTTSFTKTFTQEVDFDIVEIKNEQEGETVWVTKYAKLIKVNKDTL